MMCFPNKTKAEGHGNVMSLCFKVVIHIRNEIHCEIGSLWSIKLGGRSATIG